MKQPLISIVIPVYRAEKTLDRCIRSVLAQDFSDYEVILVDDGSPDACPAICDRYAGQYPQIHVIHRENGGVSAARNDGIAAARGVYLTFLDSDDAYHPQHLSTYCEAIQREDVDIVVGGFIRVTAEEETEELPPDQGRAGREIWETVCRLPHVFGYLWNKLFRRELFVKHGLRLREDMCSQEDLDLMLSALAVSETVFCLPCSTYRYYYAPSNRVPPIGDFLRNQLKLLCLGRERTTLSAEAEASVAKRILSLLFSALYGASEKGETEAVAAALRGVEGLVPYLKTLKPEGEHGLVARRFVKGDDRGIARYFTVRNRLRDAWRALRGNTKTR